MRALKTNEDFEAYWVFHQCQNFERNYAAIDVIPKGGKMALNPEYEMADAA